jgi:nitrogen fixation NifU-like protein
MNSLLSLYQDIILDHNRSPRNFGSLKHATHEAQGFNPLCGDKVHVYVEVEGNRIREIAFEGSGCAISTASSSLMTESLKGKTLDEALSFFESLRHFLTQPPDTPPPAGLDLGKLAALGGVRQYPTRVKCATLGWHTLQAALKPSGLPVTTEHDSHA